jgi:hypothetical protein
MTMTTTTRRQLLAGAAVLALSSGLRLPAPLRSHTAPPPQPALGDAPIDEAALDARFRALPAWAKTALLEAHGYLSARYSEAVLLQTPPEQLAREVAPIFARHRAIATQAKEPLPTGR